MVNASGATGAGSETVFERLLALLADGQAKFRLLEHPAEDPQQVHVEADVHHAGVQEAGRDHPVPLAIGDERSANLPDALRALMRRLLFPSELLDVAQPFSAGRQRVHIEMRGPDGALLLSEPRRHG